jgi:hypothetical protein
MAKNNDDDERIDPSYFGIETEPFSLQAETLSGDIRDILLGHLRTIKVPWAMLNQDEQSDKIEVITNCAQDVVRRALAILIKGGFPALIVEVGAYKVDKGVEVKVQAPATVENITLLAQHGKGTAVLILAEAADYYGERSPAVPTKDQPDLPFGSTA